MKQIAVLAKWRMHARTYACMDAYIWQNQWCTHLKERNKRSGNRVSRSEYLNESESTYVTMNPDVKQPVFICICVAFSLRIRGMFILHLFPRRFIFNPYRKHKRITSIRMSWVFQVYSSTDLSSCKFRYRVC